MMKSRSLLTGVILFQLLITSAFAQQKDIVFEKITNESGRSLGFITGIAQDTTGFMWFGTRTGLYRYNGYSYKLFKHIPGDSCSLAFNDIAHLYYDKDNQFWLRHYDELSLFKNEKRSFSFKQLTNRPYDIEVTIVQDKFRNYWIGPTGTGLLKYETNFESSIAFTYPKPTYNLSTWQNIKNLLENNEKTACIKTPGNESDTSVNFMLKEKGYYLFVSSGEIDDYGRYDYGTLNRNGSILAELSADSSMWCGGAAQNRFEIVPLQLEKGNYKLSYKSDLSHSCEQWDDAAPDKIDFCGVCLIKIDAQTYREVLNDGLKPEKPDNYIGSNKIKDLLTDNEGNFWALSNIGLEKYDYKTHRFIQYFINFEELFGTSVDEEYLTFYQDKKGNFWIGSMYGLIKYNHVWGELKVYRNTQGHEPLTSNNIFSLFEDKKGNLWIGTDRGLNILNGETGAIRKVTANNQNRLYDNNILQIFEDDGGNIWVATFKGLNRLINTKFTYTDLNFEADDQFSAFFDNKGTLWYAKEEYVSSYALATKEHRKFKLPAYLFSKNEFTGNVDLSISAMIPGDNDMLWIATGNRVSRFNKAKSEVDFSLPLGAVIVNGDSVRNKVNFLLKGKANRLFAFAPNGCYVIHRNDLAVQEFYPYNYGQEHISQVNMNFLKYVLADKTGNVWIRTTEGIYYLNAQLSQLKLVVPFDENIKDGPLTKGNLASDKYGNIWYAALPKVYRIAKETHELSSWECKFERDWGQSNVKIGNDEVWIFGTNGLFSLDTESEEFEHFSVENGFVDNNITGLEEDAIGYLWLSTLKGLIKFDRQEKTAMNFFTNEDYSRHQFIGNPQNFNENNDYKLLFTTKGFVQFNPNIINLKPPKIVIDKFTIRGKEYSVDSLIHNMNYVELRFNQNFLGFEFAVLDYDNPANNKYMYQMVGLDEDWIMADAFNRKASYSGIPPGRYEFKVKGANSNKIWNEEGASFNILIKPPWYKTIVAYILYGLLVITAIFVFIRVRERQLKEEKRILEQKVRERTAEIEAQKEELFTQNEKIAQQNKDITDSIQYAQRIQKAILPPMQQISKKVDDFFVFYRPRDIVSGDYYWSAIKENKTIIVAADCTGHGVPGAFMSMLGIAFLNEIVNKEGVVKSNVILNRLREQVINQLHQRGEDGEPKDGMDISLYVIDHEKQNLQFSGAYNPLYVIRNGELIHLKADRMPIGYHMKKDEKFKIQELDLKKGDCLYNFSDGFPDQFGGEKGRKYMSKRFKEYLLAIHQEPMKKQHELLTKEFDNWRGYTEQIDDVIVIGLRI